MKVDAYRARDIAIAAPLLILVSPALLLIAAVVRLESPGPALFRQERVGRCGATFRIHKFRTMRPSDGGPTVSQTGDPRVTRVGALLRRTKLDELPQLIDVIRGDMSLVGPRPELANYVAQWPKDAQSRILSVRPGLTDPASIRWRHESDELAASGDPEYYYISIILPRKVEMYQTYVQGRTLGDDARILLHTLVAVARVRPSN